jgi:hypothetical protein
MFVLTEIIDCIFLLFCKILSPVLSIFRCIKSITNLAHDGFFPEIALQYSLDAACSFDFFCQFQFLTNQRKFEQDRIQKFQKN